MDSTTFNVQQLFHQGSYRGCTELASANSTHQDGETRIRLLYSVRSLLALSEFARANSILESLLSQDKEDHAAQSLLSLSNYLESLHNKDAQESDKHLADLNHSLDFVVQGQGQGQGGHDSEIIKTSLAIAMQLDGDTLGALETLEMGKATSRELECIALGVHILLSINRHDLAQKEYEAARKWADDSLLIQIIEAWLGLCNGGRSAQQAFYVYDELSQNPAHAASGNVVSTLVGKAAALAALGKYAEAKKELLQAQELEPNNADILANLAALAPYGARSSEIQANPSQVYIDQLRKIAPNHPFLQELSESEAAFDRALDEVQAEADQAQGQGQGQ